MNRRQAEAFARALLEEHAPEVLTYFALIWAEGLPDCWAFTWYAREPERVAWVVIDRSGWRRLSKRKRKDLIAHEVAHLVDDHRNRPEQPHGRTWRRLAEAMAGHPLRAVV